MNYLKNEMSRLEHATMDCLMYPTISPSGTGEAREGLFFIAVVIGGYSSRIDNAIRETIHDMRSSGAEDGL